MNCFIKNLEQILLGGVGMVFQKLLLYRVLLIKSLQPLLSYKILWRWSGEGFYTEQTRSGAQWCCLFVTTREGQEMRVVC